MHTFLIATPKEFSFDHCFSFLQRSPHELLHQCAGRSVRKLIAVDHNPVLFELTCTNENQLMVTILNTVPSAQQQNEIEKFVVEWFDLETDLKPFYNMASSDALLKDLVQKFYGYRIVGQPDLFESLVWAVLGQQINLQFAYTLKQRFVQHFGHKLLYNGHYYYMFPKPGVVAAISDAQLLPLQFSRQKSKYTTHIAQAFLSGNVSKEKLHGLPLSAAKEELMKIKGVGNWTANYALMKTFHYPDAFPLEDAGVHNAIKNLKKMKVKPTVDQVKRVFKKYKGWEAYATLYLWKSL